MTEPDRIKQLETHLGLLSSRFDALEGRISAVEIQVNNIVPRVPDIETKVGDTISSIREIKGRIVLLVKNLNKTISIVESHAGIASNINDNMKMLTDSVAMVVVLDKIRDGEDPDAIIAALPDEKIRQMVRERINERRKQ